MAKQSIFAVTTKISNDRKCIERPPTFILCKKIKMVPFIEYYYF